jgi:3-oxoacyl-[acyl-carrier-protein] synthase-3
MNNQLQSKKALSGFRIAATGAYLPSRVLTNGDLEKIVETTDEWIVTRTGISERRLAEKNETASTMGIEACKDALKKANIQAEEIDLIIVATITPDAIFPSTACYIQDGIGAKNAAAFDLQAACSGFLYSLITAGQFLTNKAYQNILVVGAEKISSVIDWTDRNTCVLFGDGAGAILLTADDSAKGILSYDMGARGSEGDLLFLPTGVPSSEVHGKSAPFINMLGKEVFKSAVTEMAKSAEKILKEAGVTKDEIKCVISHQANIRIIHALRDKLEIPDEKCFVNVNKYGNMSSACIPVALSEAETHYNLKKGDKVLMVAFGGGLTWSTCLMEW